MKQVLYQWYENKFNMKINMRHFILAMVKELSSY